MEKNDHICLLCNLFKCANSRYSLHPKAYADFVLLLSHFNDLECMCMYVYVCHSMHMEVREQGMKAGSLHVDLKYHTQVIRLRNRNL